jgi:transcription initiation protein SPT3
LSASRYFVRIAGWNCIWLTDIYIGSRRRHETNDEGGVSALLRLSPGVLLVSQRCARCSSSLPTATLTFTSAKRFRDYLNLPANLDLKPNDDTVDIVGFLAFEIVRSLTVAALEVKKSLEEPVLQAHAATSPALGKRKLAASLDVSNKRRREASPDEADAPLPACSLFLPPLEARTALRPEHIQDAFVRMQGDWSQRRTANMRGFRGGLIRTGVSLI